MLNFDRLFMPRYLICTLARSLKIPKSSFEVLWLGLALVLRTLCAYLVFGALSVDDYSHGLLPTIETLHGKALEIPVWRSPLLVWTLRPWAQLGELLGLSANFSLIRWIMFGLGLFAWLWLVIYVRISDKEEKQSRAWRLSFILLSAHFLLVFGQTRAFGETLVTGAVLIAFVLFEKALSDSQKSFFWPSLILGLSCLYRFQVGVLFLGWGVVILLQKKYRAFAAWSVAGVFAAIAAGSVDLAFGRWPLETLYQYIYVNKDGAVEHSIQPWYNTWLTVLPVLAFPLSVVLLKGWRSLTRQEIRWFALIAVFVALHSMIPHKEERFLFPVVPLLLILLAQVWARSWNESFEKYFFRPVFSILLVAGALISVTSNSQSGEYEPLRFVESLNKPILVWDYKSLLSEGYFRERLLHAPATYSENLKWPVAEDFEKQNLTSVLLLTSYPEQANELEQLSVSNWDCGPVQKIQSLADSVIFRLNPRFNWRRKPTWMRLCEKSATL
jgi:Alg9-like mannosyltransferase family